MSKKRSDTKSETRERLAVFGTKATQWGWIILERLWQRAEDIGAVLLGASALLTILGLSGLTYGRLIGPWSMLLWKWLGWGAWVVPLTFGMGAYWLARARLGLPLGVRWMQLIAMEFFVIGLLGLLAMADGLDLTRAEAGYGGGILGWALATLLEELIAPFGAVLVLAVLTMLAGLYAGQGILRKLLAMQTAWRKDASKVKAQPIAADRSAAAPAQGTSRPKRGRLPREFRKNFELPEVPSEKASKPTKRDDRLPSIDLLDKDSYSRVSVKEINRAAGLIEKTLAEFGLPVRVVDFRSGPSITQFAVEPGYIEHQSSDGSIRRQKVRVSQIAGLANDLALALSAPRVRIEAPVPGQAYVGVEVPNRRSSLVRLRPILEAHAFQQIGSQLAVALGRDVAGAAVAADLAAMPHLLIAGTTGSGKSVCITALTSCLVFNNHPDDLKLVMIDPKMVELVRFNGLPHLMGKVETELERIVGVLRWCTQEMDRRYKLLEEAKARDIDSYNRQAGRRKSMMPIPRMVILIDEMADLMMMAPDETERTLVRLAQMARATGMHLVMATQRPSTDVVTGLIKANFPARISFAVPSSVDSRVILDSQGAETLMGKGDMLFLAPEAASPMRLQGVFVSDKEVEHLVKYWQHMSLGERAAGSAAPPWEEVLARKAALDEHDGEIERAIAVVRKEGTASASMLQRRLRIGYPRAARLMDELEDLGVIGRAQSGGRTREVLVEGDDDPLLGRD